MLQKKVWGSYQALMGVPRERKRVAGYQHKKLSESQRSLIANEAT